MRKYLTMNIHRGRTLLVERNCREGEGNSPRIKTAASDIPSVCCGRS